MKESLNIAFFDSSLVSGYLGNYSDDRQASLDELMLGAARKLPRQAFVVAASAVWGSPSISDYWSGLETILEPDKETSISGSTEETIRLLDQISWSERCAIGKRARTRILAEHTAVHRAMELESCVLKLLSKRLHRVPAQKRKRQNPFSLFRSIL